MKVLNMVNDFEKKVNDTFGPYENIIKDLENENNQIRIKREKLLKKHSELEGSFKVHECKKIMKEIKLLDESIIENLDSIECIKEQLIKGSNGFNEKKLELTDYSYNIRNEISKTVAEYNQKISEIKKQMIIEEERLIKSLNEEYKEVFECRDRVDSLFRKII